MKHINMGTPSGLPTATENGAPNRKKSFLSNAKALLFSACMLSLFISSAAGAQIIAHYTATNGIGTAVTYTTNATGTALTTTGLGSNTPCSSGGLSGLTNNGVTTFSTSNGHVYFTITANPGYVLNVSNYTCKLRRSNSGIQKVRMAYATTGSVINDLIDRAPDNTSCGGGTDVYTWNSSTGGALPTGVTTFTAELFPYAPIASGGVIQFNDITIDGTVSISSVACPSTIATATVTPSSATVCGLTPVSLALSGYSTGSAITYQWQSSPTGTSSWTNISGATGTSYSFTTANPVSATTTYYQAVTTCTLSATSQASTDAEVTVNNTPSAGTIGGTLVLPIGSTSTLTATGASGGSDIGIWYSSNTSVATIDPTAGIYGGVSAGATTISYTVTDPSSGCNATTTANGSVIYPGTLATYIGTGGTSTSVISTPGNTASALVATGFGSNTPCSSGGLSGLTVATTVATYNTTTGPKVTYTVTADAGSALNVYGFYATVRRSTTGPDSFRIAYSTDGTTWTDNGYGYYLPSGSCGSTANTYHWVPNAAITGVPSIIVGVFPYSSSNNSGTFQLTVLETDGVMSSSTACSGTPVAGTITPSVTVGCDSAYASLTFSSDSGVGISMIWEVSTDGGMTFTPVAGASNATYISPEYYAGTVTEFRAVTTCANSGDSAISPVSSLSVTPALGSISGIPSPYLYAGETVTLTAPSSPLVGTWSSKYVPVASVDSTSPSTASLTGGIAGYSIITYSTAGYNCRTTDTVFVADSNTVALYIGENGNSTNTVSLVPTAATVSTLTATGFGSNTLCSEGGLSGMTVNTAVTTYSSSNPNVGYAITATSGSTVTINAIHASLRSSASGPQLVRIAYSINGGASWTDNGSDLSADVQSCGVSTMDINFVLPAPVTNSSFLIDVFPFASVSSEGTFQVNALDVTGYACGNPGPITDVNGNLDGQTYGAGCNVALSCTPFGGTWSSSDPVNAPVDTYGNLMCGSVMMDEPVTITYTDECGTSVSNATFTLSAMGGASCDGSARYATPTAVKNASQATDDVTIYPNPATMTLNIGAAQQVNVTVLSMDGRTLMSQSNAKAMDISKLASGVYMIQVYNAGNSLIKTAKFTKE